MGGRKLPRFALCVCLLATKAAALPLWELQGGKGAIHILGSVHFLRERDYPLPGVVTSLFEDADVVIFEIDLGALDPVATQATLQKLAVDPRGRDLEDHLGAAEYRRAQAMAADIDIDLAGLRPYEPWFAALQVTQLRLAQLGFDGSWGIEAQFALRALTAGKRMGGLETLEEQFGALDSLPLAAQREFLIKTLEQSAEIETDLDRIIIAWRNGDTDTLEDELLTEVATQPELYSRILVERNRNWTRRITELTASPQRHLIVVGALHLVGQHSVIRMLEEAGYRLKKID